MKHLPRELIWNSHASTWHSGWFSPSMTSGRTARHYDMPLGLLGLDVAHEESLDYWTKLTASFSPFHLVHKYELDLTQWPYSYLLMVSLTKQFVCFSFICCRLGFHVKHTRFSKLFCEVKFLFSKKKMLNLDQLSVEGDQTHLWQGIKQYRRESFL